MSSYCPQALYFSMNGVNYYYCQSCDTCSFVCLALSTMPDCGGCCPRCCGRTCNETVNSATIAILDVITHEDIVTIPGDGVQQTDYIQANTPYKRQYPGISVDSDDRATLYDDQGNAHCKLRLLSFRIDAGGGTWRLVNIGQQLDPLDTAAGKKAKKTIPSTGKFHRVKLDTTGDNRQFDIITKDDIQDLAPAAAGRPNVRARRNRGRQR